MVRASGLCSIKRQKTACRSGCPQGRFHRSPFIARTPCRKWTFRRHCHSMTWLTHCHRPLWVGRACRTLPLALPSLKPNPRGYVSRNCTLKVNLCIGHDMMQLNAFSGFHQGFFSRVLRKRELISLCVQTVKRSVSTSVSRQKSKISSDIGAFRCEN
jgi:hypothetical protein